MMIVRIIIPTIAALLLSACGGLRLNRENHADAVARSVRDSTLAISMDTAFYAGHPLYRVSGGADLLGGNPLDIHDLTGDRLLARAYPRYYLRGSDTVIYRVSFNTFGSKVLVKVREAPSHLEEASVVKFMIDSGILSDGRADVAAITRLLASHAIEDDAVAGEAYALRSTNWRAKSSEGAGAVMGSVRVRNRCSTTVRLFIGEKPGYSSGRTESISGNGVASLGAIRRGEMLWIVDANRNPITGTQVGETTTEIEITEDGRGMRQK